MTLNEQDRKHLEREYDGLASEVMHYFDTIVATERLIIAGAAAVIAFLYTDLTNFAAGQASVLSALPLAIVLLGGLRCLAIFIAILNAAEYLRVIENELLTRKDLGMQRRYVLRSSPTLLFVVATTTLFWSVAAFVSGYFWWVYTPAQSLT